MEFTRISIPITANERDLLRALAHSLERDPRQLARAILRNALGIAESRQENKQAFSVEVPRPAENAPLTIN